MSKLRKLKESRAAKMTELENLRADGEKRSLNADEEKRFSDMVDEVELLDTKIKEEQRFLNLQFDKALEVNRNQNKNQSADERRNAYRAYLAGGKDSLNDEQRSALETRDSITGVSGSVLIPSEMADSIEVALKQYGGMMEAGTIMYTSTGGDLTMPTVNDTASKATIVSEYGQSSTAKPTFSSLVLKAYTYRTPIIPLSLELIQDAAYNIETTVGGLLTDSFGRALNAAFTTGTGTNEPKGIVTAATDCGTTAAASAITYDNLIALLSSVDGAYAKVGKFMFNTKTLWALMSIKDTTNRPIIQNSVVEGVPPTILGKQYIINDDMPDIGSGKTSVLFGDLSKYRIRIVKGFVTRRLDEALAEYLAVGIMGFGRADGNLLDAGTNPVKKLVHATAS